VLAEAAANGKSLGDAFVQLNQALATQSDKVAVFKLVVELAKPYPEIAEAQYAVAQAGYNTGLADLEILAQAVRAADRALELKPGWERGALLKADILAKSSRADAIRFLNAFLAGVPESKAATGALAQLYVEQKRYGEARALFQRLYEDDPSDHDIAFAIAALSMQMKDYAAAEPLLQELKASGYGDPGVAAFYLAQIAEETKRYDEAIAHYREVTQGERAWTAKLRIAAMLAKKDSVDAARRYLDTLQADGRDQQTERVQAEAQLLRDAGDLAGAYSKPTPIPAT
jgi:tetratricopeptide (TPR) repeat protein